MSRFLFLHEGKLLKLILALGLAIVPKMIKDARLVAYIMFLIPKIAKQKNEQFQEVKIPNIELPQEFQLKASTVINFTTPDEIANFLTNEKARECWDLNLEKISKLRGGRGDTLQLTYSSVNPVTG
jgi:hypothetical protein